jgi:hypothetical protein
LSGPPGGVFRGGVVGVAFCGSVGRPGFVGFGVGFVPPRIGPFEEGFLGGSFLLRSPPPGGVVLPPPLEVGVLILEEPFEAMLRGVNDGIVSGAPPIPVGRLSVLSLNDADGL